MQRTITLPSATASPSRVFLSPIPTNPRPNSTNPSPGMLHQSTEPSPYILSKDIVQICDAMGPSSSASSTLSPLSPLLGEPLGRTDSRCSFLSLSTTDSCSSASVASPDDSTLFLGMFHHELTSSLSATSVTSTQKSSTLSLKIPAKLKPTRFPQWIKQISSPIMTKDHQDPCFPIDSLPPQPQQNGKGTVSERGNRRPLTSLAQTRDDYATSALYYGSPRVRQYLRAAMAIDRFDDMLAYGFPCNHRLGLPMDEIDGSDDSLSQRVHKKATQRKPHCEQCQPGQQPLWTIRITLTPLHCRAKDVDIYGLQRTSSNQSTSFRQTALGLSKSLTQRHAKRPCTASAPSIPSSRPSSPPKLRISTSTPVIRPSSPTSVNVTALSPPPSRSKRENKDEENDFSRFWQNNIDRPPLFVLTPSQPDKIQPLAPRANPSNSILIVRWR
ncbi:uncharacterized protein BYT42DRAFT_575498 [Radiomyces spectabilis]|uniref:uncharacterized protein n=1 Tax=Radiomyces spectabilis TaxID=64574 RepID=UPI00221EE79C|nr:uncharacterized protein BYT42DRAFT_575498 [Radiomyces spectabilis]KAI8374218.1 hypothetical protein BYT42DRAFT_575498 [Radiomyces spectabilis]